MHVRTPTSQLLEADPAEELEERLSYGSTRFYERTPPRELRARERRASEDGWRRVRRPAAERGPARLRRI